MSEVSSLWPHQVETIKFGLKNKYCIYALEMGLGKSLCGLETFFKSGSHKLLVICPSYLIKNWENEIKKFYPEKEVTTFCSTKAIKKMDKSKMGIVVTSYNLIQNAEHLFYWADFAIADEAHNLKSMTAKRTKFFHQVVFESSVKRLILMTGTPIRNAVHEYYSLLCLCNYNPQFGGRTKFLELYPYASAFADRFSNRREYDIRVGSRTFKNIKWEGVRNIEELKNFIRPFYIRKRSSEILDLPPVIYKDVFISDIDNSELYEAFKTFVEENKQVLPGVKANAALETAPFTIKYVESLFEEIHDSPILIYSDHVASTSIIAEKLKIPKITGDTPVSVRMKLAEEFQAGKLKGLVATIGSFSTGFTLTRSCNLVFNDLPWVTGDMEQAIYRIVRIGQKNQCVVHRMLGYKQASYILKTLEEKKKVIEIAT